MELDIEKIAQAVGYVVETVNGCLRCPTNCGVQLTKSNFRTRSITLYLSVCGESPQETLLSMNLKAAHKSTAGPLLYKRTDFRNVRTAGD